MNKRFQELRKKRPWITPLGILTILIIITGLIILYGKGYRFGIAQDQLKLSKTGILNAQSIPQGATVYINDHPTTATDNTVNLLPGKYSIKIAKDGYYDWQKDVQIEAQVVSNTDATLFPRAPSLQSISTLPVKNPIIDPSGTRLAFQIGSESGSFKKQGIYVLDMTSRSFPVLPLQSSATQLIDDTLDTFSQAILSWSPDGREILASTSGTLGTPTDYLLTTTGFNSTPQDVTATLPQILASWQQQQAELDTARMASLPRAVRKMITQDFHILSWSSDPNPNKILYVASQSATLPIIITPRRIGNNLLYEQRTIQKGSVYVYDIKEDVNTRILDHSINLCSDSDNTCNQPIRWFPDSDHLLYVHDKKIDIVEDDGANTTTIYAGPFDQQYVYPWPDGTKLVILTNLGNTSIPPTLYTISLK